MWDTLRAARNDMGLLSFGQYMDLALYSPEGYYQRAVRLGGAGSDFYTAAQFPIFGMTIGRYISQRWSERAGFESPLHIVELGPGQGELAYQVCSYLVSEGVVDGPIEYTFVERSKYLSRVQRNKVSVLEDRIAYRWLDPTESPLLEADRASGESVLTVRPHAFVISNELLDALPVERVRRTDAGLLQSYIRVADDEDLLEETFLRADELLTTMTACYAPVPAGHTAEVCLHYHEVFRLCASLANEVDGVFFDYGTYKDEWAQGIRPSGTLRAYREHQLVNPLETPGYADLTADVNWDLASDAAREAGFTVQEICGQGSFLMKHGMMEVAAKLAAHPELLSAPGHVRHPSGPGVPSQTQSSANMLSPTVLLSGAIKQLVLPGGMGDRFSAFVFSK